MPKLIRGEGPVPNWTMWIGEAPGWQEEKQGRVFVGKTGDELNRLLQSRNLPERKEIYLTNFFKNYKGERAGMGYADEDIQLNEPLLIAELRQVRPELIVTLGRVATRWFLGEVDIESVQGLPWLLTHHDKFEITEPVVVFPTVHPAAAFHNSEMANYVVAGFNALEAHLAGDLEPRILFNDPYPEPIYEEITTIEHLRAVLSTLEGGLPAHLRRKRGQVSSAINLSIDTEGSPARPWSIQFSVQPGIAYLIRKSREDLLAIFGEYLARYRPRVTYHSALHDLGMMRALKLPTDLEFDDTMVMAYLLQLEPQGLKPLCVRWCGMQMQSYMEVLGDAGQRLALDYFMGLWDIEQLDWEEARANKFWEEIDKGRRLKVYPKLPKTALHKAVERILRSKDARKLWGNQVEDIQVAGYNRLGPLPEPTLDHVPAPVAIHYGSRDADGTTRVRNELEPRVTALGLRGVYELELGTYPLIERMAYIGLKPDLEHFANLSANLQGEIDYLQVVLDGVIERHFNANSGDQVADYVFGTLGLEGNKRTKGRDGQKGRFSTNDKILEALEREHPEFPILSTIREYREVYKLKNTFVDRLPDFVRRWPYDGRIHATFRTTRVVTGRLAASDPNLLAMPKHGKFAKDFRMGWVEDPGFVLAEWDLSQIELRVLAHLSQDPVLLAVYRGQLKNPDGSPIDLHANLAQRIFGGKPEDHKKGTGRLAAKAINFGLPMGMTYKGLTLELRKNGVNVSEDDAQKWIDETFALYKGVPPYQERMAREAARYGYIRCLSGRIRYIGGIGSRNEMTAEEAKRFAFSTPIQEGAQWLMKQNEVRLWALLQRYWKAGKAVEPLIQVHDALTLRAPNQAPLLHELNQDMVGIMTTIPEGFSVPVETSGDYGTNWAPREVDKATGKVTNDLGMRDFAELKRLSRMVRV